MATPSEKLSQSLELLHDLQDRGVIALRSKDLTRTHRERLLQNGFLQEVMKGWYIPARPDELTGESTAWYASYWHFCAAYLEYRFGDEWSLAPEQSIALHAENMTVPRQLLVRAKKARNNITQLPYNTSLVEVRASLPTAKEEIVIEGLRIFSLPTALIGCSERFFRINPTDMRAALAMIRDASEVLAILLNGGHSLIAGRLAGAFRNIGRSDIADELLDTMKSASYQVTERDPFETPTRIIFSKREVSPYVNRIRLMWDEFRDDVIEHFPAAPTHTVDTDKYLQRLDKIYVTDAYHSLSIEGYRVSHDLIERVRSGAWNPDEIKEDQEHINTLAARGYWQASQVVRESIEKVLEGENPGSIAADDHRRWYREMFSPSIGAGLLKPSDLAGYRNGPVYIRYSMHVPPSREAVRDAMPVLFELLENESEESVRVVLGHFFFVYIHPYMDGNGRMGRFLMNLMMASGDYPWLVIPVEERDTYMDTLEAVTRDQDIKPFANFIARLIQATSVDRAEKPQ